MGKKKVKRAVKGAPKTPSMDVPDVQTVTQETVEATQPLMQAVAPAATSLAPIATTLSPIATTMAPVAQYATAPMAGGPLLPMYSGPQQMVQMPTAQAYAPMQATQVQFPA